RNRIDTISDFSREWNERLPAAGSTARVGRSAICDWRDLLVTARGKWRPLFRLPLRGGVMRSDAGLALLGTDASITSAGISKSTLARIRERSDLNCRLASAVATSRRLCFRTDSWGCHCHREFFLLRWVQGRGRTCPTR